MESSLYSTRAKRLSAEALRILLNHSWPGNVRELKNTIERALVLCQGEEISAADLPPPHPRTKEIVPGLRAAFLSQRSLADVEREYILAGMALTSANKKEVADILKIDRKTLYRRLEEYGWTDS